MSPTSSTGRLFDAVSAICGLCVRSSYEERAPMRLEGAAARAAAGTYPFTLAEEGGQLTVDWSELVRGMVADARRRLPAGTISRRFHDTLAAAIVAAASPSRNSRRRSRHLRCSGRSRMQLKYIDEIRDPATAKALVERIRRDAGDAPVRLMEVCGTHTVAIARGGIRPLLSGGVRMRTLAGGVRAVDYPVGNHLPRT